jgi:hypothetical protein
MRFSFFIAMGSDVHYIKFPIVNLSTEVPFTEIEKVNLGQWAINNGWAFPPVINNVLPFIDERHELTGYVWDPTDDRPYHATCYWHVTWPLMIIQGLWIDQAVDDDDPVLHAYDPPAGYENVPCSEALVFVYSAPSDPVAETRIMVLFNYGGEWVGQSYSMDGYPIQNLWVEPAGLENSDVTGLGFQFVDEEV